MINRLEQGYENQKIPYVINLVRIEYNTKQPAFDKINRFFLDLYLECYDSLTSLESDMCLVIVILGDGLLDNNTDKKINPKEVIYKINNILYVVDDKYLYNFYDSMESSQLNEIYSPDESKIMLGFIKIHPEYKKNILTYKWIHGKIILLFISVVMVIIFMNTNI